MATAFIIYGRDLAARDALAAFLRQAGLRVIPFADRSLGLSPNAFIADIVLEALDRADVLVALFTPDEQAALYDSASGRLVKGETRWQARQNVIFEAGVAFGLHREKTILATMGADVRLFSDLAGVHFVELQQPGGAERLMGKLRGVVPGLRKRSPPRAPNAFKSIQRKRWEHYDDLETMLACSDACRLGRGKHKTTLARVLRRMVTLEKHWTWANSPRPKRLMNAIADEFTAAVTNEAYWWLVVYGFFQFDNIDQFFDGPGDDWTDSVDYCVFSSRGVALWNRLAAVAS